MRIEGQWNKESNRLTVIVDCDNQIEIESFTSYFEDMIHRLVKDSEGIMIDPQHGVAYTAEGFPEEKVQEYVEEFSKSEAIRQNKNTAPEFKNKFI